MSQSAETFLEIESRLLEDADGNHLKTLTEDFDTRRQAVERRLALGVPPDEYRRLEAAAGGYAAAAAVLRIVWKRLHETAL